MTNNTPCIRCGKTRIVAKSWQEHIGGSLATYTLTVCPDPECQKIVDSELQKRRDKITAIQNKSLERRKIARRARKPKNTAPK